MLCNSPPSSGAFALAPRAGVVLSTAFAFACAGWVDDAADLPLLYSFYYMIAGGATEFQLVAATPATSYAGARLPRGGGNQSRVVGVAYPADQVRENVPSLSAERSLS